MRLNLMILPLAWLATTAASAATFVLDNFDTPTPPIAIDTATGSVLGGDLHGPYGRSMAAYGFVDGAVSYRIGDGAFVRRPTAGADGETDILYLLYGVGGPGPLDLSGYHYLRLDFNDVTNGYPLNLNAEFFTSNASPAKPLYYGDVGINYVYDLGHRSAYLPLDAVAAAFDFSYVQGIGIFMDRSGVGVDGFSLDRIVLTTAGPGVPEPASWALMVGGFGLVGAMARRRGRVVFA